MTPTEAKLFLPLIQAFAGGKKIECRSKGRTQDPWRETPGPLWLPECEYRVKVEPVELELWYKPTTGSLYSVAKTDTGNYSYSESEFQRHGFVKKKFREVLE